MTHTRSLRLLAAVALVLWAGTASAYRAMDTSWPAGRIPLHLRLGNSTGEFVDGTSGTWNSLAEAAAASWNRYVDTVAFQVISESTAPVGDANGTNNVYFTDRVFGEPFEATTVAVTIGWSLRGVKVESDVLLNTGRTWNSYRGDVRPGIVDFRRVALHEFGHVLGLEHPNAFGQNVRSIMNSPLSSVDSIMGDDVSGAQALYSAGVGSSVSFPPRDESLDFRRQLEALYQNQLRASPAATAVDVEGSIVWLSEYLRYRVGRCAHATAALRVFSQMDDTGVYGLCSVTTPEQAAFPPRNEALDFRVQLETKYRESLRRGLNATYVDNEGDVVWLQEYLRYRLNGCSHGDATSKVFSQVLGLGIQPLCR